MFVFVCAVYGLYGKKKDLWYRRTVEGLCGAIVQARRTHRLLMQVEYEVNLGDIQCKLCFKDCLAIDITFVIFNYLNSIFFTCQL